MAIPKPKPESVLDEEDYVDLRRTEITLRLRMQRRREVNELYKDVLAKREKGKLLSAKPVLELTAPENELTAAENEQRLYEEGMDVSE